jgi:hypothetical protein
MSKDDIVIGAGFKQLTSCFSIGLQYVESGPISAHYSGYIFLS